MNEATVRLSLGEVREFARATLTRVGLSPVHVEAVAETIVAGERNGCGARPVSEREGVLVSRAVLRDIGDVTRARA